MEVFKPRFSIAGWISSVGLIVFFLLVAWISCVSEKSLYFLFVLAMILVFSFLLVALFFLAIYPTMRYEMRRDGLRLVCGPFNWSIPYSEIKEITRSNLKYHPSSTGWKLPGYTIGRVYYKNRGDVRMCATGMCKNIILIETEDLLYGVTPTDEGRFFDSLRERTSHMTKTRRRTVDLNKVQESVSHYLAQLEGVHKLLGIDQAAVGDVLSKFNSLEPLRKRYNQHGSVDYLATELAMSIGHLRFAISNLCLFHLVGLTDFEVIKTEYGPFGRAKGGRWTATDRMFFYFVDSALERLYGFWNRIAYLLNIFFNVESREEKALFPQVIDQMNSKFKRLAQDQHFKDLREFKDKDYTDFNRKRATIVHKRCSWSNYFTEALRLATDLDGLRGLQVERDEWPDFFLQNFERAHKGIDEAIAIIKDNVDQKSVE